MTVQPESSRSEFKTPQGKDDSEVPKSFEIEGVWTTVDGKAVITPISPFSVDELQSELDGKVVRIRIEVVE